MEEQSISSSDPDRPQQNKMMKTTVRFHRLI